MFIFLISPKTKTVHTTDVPPSTCCVGWKDDESVALALKREDEGVAECRRRLEVAGYTNISEIERTVNRARVWGEPLNADPSRLLLQFKLVEKAKLPATVLNLLRIGEASGGAMLIETGNGSGQVLKSLLEPSTGEKKKEGGA